MYIFIHHRNGTCIVNNNEAWGKCLTDVYSDVSGHVMICEVGTICEAQRDAGRFNATGLATVAGLKIRITDNEGSDGESTNCRTVRDCRTPSPRDNGYKYLQFEQY